MAEQASLSYKDNIYLKKEFTKKEKEYDNSDHC